MSKSKELMESPKVKKRFDQLLGKKAPGFISSVLQVINNNKLLKNADPMTVYTAAATAAALDLPINQSLGFAWIVPFRGQASFQMGWKGYVQLAQRSGQYKRINVTEVYENQYKSFNALTEELNADFDTPGEGKVVGYAAYFLLLNGMEKLVYWSKEKVIKHATMYSQTYGRKNKSGKLIHSPWNNEDQFDAMAKKTVLKNMISKWGIMSIEMQKSVLADQSIQSKEGQYEYPDNEDAGIDIEKMEANKERERVKEHIENSADLETLSMVDAHLSDDELKELYEAKKTELSKPQENG